MEEELFILKWGKEAFISTKNNKGEVFTHSTVCFFKKESELLEFTENLRLIATHFRVRFTLDLTYVGPPTKITI